MSVSENVTKQVCAIDHGGEFFDLRKYTSSAVGAWWQIVHAQISFVQYTF